MKKILILIVIIIIIIGGIYIYKHFSNKDNELRELETNQLITVISTQKEDYFLLYIDEIINDNSNIDINGTISRGNIKVNDEISIVGLNKKEVVAKILKIKINDEEKESAKEGDNINMVLESNFTEDNIAIGQAVIKTKTTKPTYNINAVINAISTKDILELENKVNAFCINTDIKCSVKVLSEGKNEVKIKLDTPIVIDNGIEISLKKGNKVIAKGIAINN